VINDVANRELGLAASFFKASNAEKGSVSGQNFGQLMSDLEARETVAPVPRERNNDNSNRNDRTNERDNNRTRETSRRTESRENPVSRELQSNQMSNDYGTQEVADVAVNPENDSLSACETVSEEVEEAIVCEIAALVYVPQEAVLEYLGELELKPGDIAEPQNANKLLQGLLKVESPIELLAIPDYPETLKEVVEKVQELVETGEAAKVAKPNLEQLVGLKVEVNDQNQLVVSAADEEQKSELLPKDAFAQMAKEDNQTDNSRSNASAPTVLPAKASYDETGSVFQEGEVLKPDVQSVNVDSQINPAALAAQQEAVQAVAQKTAPTRVDPTQVMEQILSKVKTVSAENFAELRINLRPEHLGDVTLRIATQNGVVAALFVAENQRIKEIIESQFNQLKAALAEQGIEVAELFVSVNSEDSERQMNEFLKAQQEALRRLQRAAGVVSDVEEEDSSEEAAILMDNTVDFSA
jgi:flagellar hook-length control protein FliK